MVYRFIDDNKNIVGLRWLCNKFGISPNCYYNYKKEAKRKYHKRLAHIFELIKYVYYNNNCVIGYRAMRIFIKRYGYEVSNTTMHKYMNKELNLCAVIMHSKPGYKTGKKNKIFDNLLNQNFTVDRKNKVWCTDFTYMRQPNGKFRYNCSIIDLYDRSAVASLNSDYINTDLAINTLKTALKKENYSKVILHSDQGVQFTSLDFVNFCKANNITQSMSKAGCPYDNAPMERFYNTFKSNFYNVSSFPNVEMMATVNAKSIEDIKSFISRQKETYKIPYETHPEDRPRQCVFVGTSNSMDFLPLDRTGNRRFAPILVHPDRVEKHILEDEKEARNYIIQALAEAMELYRSGQHELKLSKDTENYLCQMQKEFMPEDAKVGIIQLWLDELSQDYVCSTMIYKEAFDHEYDTPKDWELKEINNVMNNSISGWEKISSHRFAEYGIQRGWRRIADKEEFHKLPEHAETPFDKK